MATSHLFNRSQTVIFDSVESSPLPITHGVPQGSVIGALLFSILINETSRVGNKAEIILYADDTSINYAHKDPEMIQETLENQCNTIHVNSLRITIFTRIQIRGIRIRTPQRLSTAEKIEIS